MRMTRPKWSLWAATRRVGAARPLAAGSAQMGRRDACAANRESRRAERDCCCPRWPVAGAAAAEGPPCLARSDLAPSAGFHCSSVLSRRRLFKPSQIQIAALSDRSHWQLLKVLFMQPSVSIGSHMTAAAASSDTQPNHESNTTSVHPLCDDAQPLISKLYAKRRMTNSLGHTNYRHSLSLYNLNPLCMFIFSRFRAPT